MLNSYEFALFLQQRPDHCGGMTLATSHVCCGCLFVCAITSCMSYAGAMSRHPAEPGSIYGSSVFWDEYAEGKVGPRGRPGGVYS